MVEVKFWLKITAMILAVVWTLMPFIIAAIDGFFGMELITLERD